MEEANEEEEEEEEGGRGETSPSAMGGEGERVRVWRDMAEVCV